MDFRFGEDPLLFQSAVRDFLAKEHTPEVARAAWERPGARDAALWQKLAGVGVPGLLVPESHGGLALSEIEGVLIHEELGRAAAPGPVLETAAVVAPALGDGATVGTAVLDGSPYVPHAHVASLALVPGGLLRTDGASLTAVDAIDGGRRLFTVDGPVEPYDYDEALAFDRGALAAAAYLVGLSARMIDVAAEYARQREQYGRPIGVNQAVKHLLADALLKVEFAKPAVYRAAWSVAEGEPTRARDVSMAKAFASDAAYRSSRSAMQVHGAIGYTWEADLQLWMKKAWALQRAWGDATFHRRRVAKAVL
jgi:alkylation response protein AidB-like acyl-CoA dehydrogenase